MRFLPHFFIAFAALLFQHPACWAQPSADSDLGRLHARLDTQADEIRRLQEQLDARDSLFGPVPSTESQSCTPDSVERLPLVMEQPLEFECDAAASDTPFHRLHFYADYDRGFVIRPFDVAKHPFELKVNGWIQFRHHGFASDVDSWTDNAGVTRDVRDRSAFDIERARLVFSGHAVDERLTYFFHLDGDTDGEHTVDLFDYWWGWQLTDRFQVQFGKRKVPGSRQWLLGARATRFVDRPMANDFFRPDRTVGIFGIGTIGDTGHYELMLGNGYSSANVPNSQSDDRFTVAATGYVDPLGSYGGQLVDFDRTADPLVRLGHSLVYSPQSGIAAGQPHDEADFVRLSDGTRLTQVGALAPGVTISEFDVLFYGIDAAMKWRGWSANAEVFLRWIEELEGNGPLPVADIFQHGFYGEGGYFLIPKKLDVNLRYSQVRGPFGDAEEYATGCNWYPLSKTQLKVSFDVTHLHASPLQNTTSDILVGDDGMLFRTQFQAEF